MRNETVNETTLEDIAVKVGGEDTSLAGIAGFNMDDVTAVRFSNLPAGAYSFVIKEPGELSSITIEEIETALIKIKMEVADVHSIVDDAVDAEALVGKLHSEGFILKDEDAVGRFKAFLEDSGFEGGGTIQEILVALEGHAFEAMIVHVTNKKDKDRPYANLRFKKKTA